ncbi:MAG TPA: hypothetical protein VN577_24315 [Terriglobales bacterium]|nr:hypothetical protein [Terriglobales bacterium]
MSDEAAHLEYDRISSYFKYLVTLTAAFMTLLLGAAGYLFYSNLRDVRADAKSEAERIAKDEAARSVKDAFDENNINAMILEAARHKVGSVTDKLIQEQLGQRLKPLQELVLFVGQISESDTRMRIGYRSGFDEIRAIRKQTHDPAVLRFADTTLSSTTQHYESSWGQFVKNGNEPALKALQTSNFRDADESEPVPETIRDVVRIINNSPDLNRVALAFFAFRELSGEHAAMFDIDSVNSWCARTGKCK